MSHEWNEYWRGLRSRRLIAAVALMLFLPLWIVLGPVGLLAGFLGVFLSYIWLRAFPCPRCALPIVGVKLTTFPERCVGCGLRIFGHVDDIAGHHATSPDVLTLSPRLRRTIGAYEMLAGGSLMVMTIFTGGLPLWYVVTLEGLAAFGIAAGWWLWHDEQRGYALTRTLQLAQLVRVQSPLLLYLATAGFALDITHANENIMIQPGFAANLLLRWRPEMPFGVEVNLWAAAVFLLLLHARPSQAGVVPHVAVEAALDGTPAVAPITVAQEPAQP